MISYLELIKKHPDLTEDILNLKHTKDVFAICAFILGLFSGYIIWVITT